LPSSLRFWWWLSYELRPSLRFLIPRGQLVALLISSPACLCCAILGCGMISRGAPSYLVAGRLVLRSEPNDTRLVCSWAMRHEPVSAAELLACKDKWPAAKWLLKLSLGLKRLVGAILEPSDQTCSPLSFGFGRRDKLGIERDCSHTCASRPAAQLQAVICRSACRCFQAVASKQLSAHNSRA